MKTLHSIRASLAAIVLAAGVLGAGVLPTFADSSVPLADPAAPATCDGFATTTTLNQHLVPVTAGAPLTISGVVTARYGPVQLFVDGQLLTTVFLAYGWPYGRFSYTIPGFSAQSLTVGTHTLMAQYEGYQGLYGTSCPSTSAPITQVISQHW